MEPISMKAKESVKEKETFELTKEINGMRKTVRGEEVENGWVITITKNWEEKNPLNDSKEYKSGTWKYISKEDPRKSLEEDPAEERDDVKNMLNQVVKSQGDILV